MKTRQPTGSISRRNFLRTAAAAAAGALAGPLIVPSRLLGANSPANRVRVGQIGCGRIGTVHDMPGVMKSGLADYVAVCDLDSKRAAAGREFVLQDYAKKNTSAPDVAVYGDFRELLARKDIDAVVISCPDHWHAELALAAALAGKDIYLQKPMTMTLAEGIAVRDAIVKSGRIFQIGSQQRSDDPWPQFRRACELVRGGRAGQLRRIEIGLPADPTAPDDPEQPVPANLNYDRWLGPTEQAYYTEQRVHSQQNVGSRPGWLRHEAHCLGMITGWGAHHVDTAHWAMDTELGGPLTAEGTAEFPTNKIWNVHGAFRVELNYPRGIDVIISDKFPNGLKFIGDEGWIFVSRDAQAATASDPAIPPTNLKPLDAGDPVLLDPAGLKVELRRSSEQHKDWLECVQTRRAPCTSAPVAHRSTSACIISWIAMRTGRLLSWDAAKERFLGDDAANAMLTLPERAPYGALRLAKA